MLIFRKLKILLLTGSILLVLGSGRMVLAEEIILKDLGGQSVDLSSYKGKPVVLFFWTTWCPYCRVELRTLNQRSSAMAKEGIVVLGVNVSEPEYRVQRFFKGYPLNFAMLLDRDGLLADKYDLMGVPTYVFLDKTGQVISKVNSLPQDYKSLLFK